MEEVLSGILLEVFNIASQNLGAIIGVSFLITIATLLAKVRNDLMRRFAKLSDDFPKLIHAHDTTVKMSIDCDQDINIELSNLLFGTKGSRVGLFLFHNGSVFSTNSPIWKISGTHERCVAGTTQEFQNVQDVKASLLTPLISPMFTGVNTAGVHSIAPRRCPVTGERCGKIASIFRVDTDTISNSFAQTFLTNRGTKFGILSPLTDWNDAVVGFVFVEYCHDGYLSEDELLENTHLACATTSRIYQLISGVDPDSVLDATSKCLK